MTDGSQAYILKRADVLFLLKYIPKPEDACVEEEDKEMCETWHENLNTLLLCYDAEGEPDYILDEPEDEIDDESEEE